MKVTIDGIEFMPSYQPRKYLGIVEGRGVYAGDTLYKKDGNQPIVFIDERQFSDTPFTKHFRGLHGESWIRADWLSWNPPKKKTFTLNGEELQLPDGDNYFLGIDTGSVAYTLHEVTRNPYHTYEYFWRNKSDRDKVE